jgi:hypothetical protein
MLWPQGQDCVAAVAVDVPDEGVRRKRAPGIVTLVNDRFPRFLPPVKDPIYQRDHSSATVLQTTISVTLLHKVWRF